MTVYTVKHTPQTHMCMQLVNQQYITNFLFLYVCVCVGGGMLAPPCICFNIGHRVLYVVCMCKYCIPLSIYVVKMNIGQILLP